MLESSKVFGKLKPEQLKILREIAQERGFESGQQIFKQGDAGDGVYLVKDGLVEISGTLADNARHVFSEAAPGDIFGEMAVLEDKPRSASAIARTKTSVYFFAREDMLKLVERSPTLALLFLREISNRLREFNQQYLREVVQSERLGVVGKFARSIVHDLKNPLNIIGLSAELAGAERATSETRHEAQIRIRKQVDRISDMIGEILDFTQGSQSAVVCAPAEYGQFVQSLVEEMKPEVALKSVSIDLTGPLPDGKILLDPKRLRRVFYNLIHNSTDAMPKGGKITIRVEANERELVTEIEDTGSGIAPEIQGKLFEAFATHGKAHGTGLGLSICKKIVEDHGGWIRSRNAPTRGAIFSFGLPTSQPQA
jgi:signal transduction histidine kinase